MNATPPPQVTFVAQSIQREESDDEVVLTLAEQQDGTGQCLVLQVNRLFSEADMERGVNAYRLSNEQGASLFGGIRTCVLRGNRLEFGFDSAAAAVLLIPEDCAVELKADAPTLGSLRADLWCILTTGRATPDVLTLEA